MDNLEAAQVVADEIRELFLRELAKLPAEVFNPDPYVEEADANPERRDNGCMIYRVGA